MSCYFQQRGWMGWLAGFVLLTVAAFAQEAAGGGADTLPGCRSECGGVSIPYPFGIGENCSEPSDFGVFNINCTGDKPYIAGDQYEVRDIFLSNATARVVVNTTAICSSERTFRPLWGGYNMRLSPSSNVFTVLGGDALGIFRVYVDNRTFNQTVGCVSMSPVWTEGSGGFCNGIGCCQTSVDFPAWGYSTIIMKVDDGDISGVSKVYSVCYHAFVVEGGYFNYSGQKYDVQPGAIMSSPLLAEWSIGSTCEDARRNRSTYACVSGNSRCVDSKAWGHTCRCQEGYEGNPYLPNGCRDIDECMRTPGLCGDWDCVNEPGNYTCIPPPVKDSFNQKTTFGVAGGVVLAILISALCCLEFQRRKISALREKHFKSNGGTFLQELLSAHQSSFKIFSYKQLTKATNNFSRTNILGQGGFGIVYRGTTDDSVAIAVKKSTKIDGKNSREFANELFILSQVNHGNVVKLLGCCLEDESPMLVYEFVPGGTLFDHIHGGRQRISFRTRLDIATRTAGAFKYLHFDAAPPILHGDVKSSNILLDGNLQPRVSDFGNSKLVPNDCSKFTTLVRGTCGYMDPEYLRTGVLMDKSDVFSFGVVLLELLTRTLPLIPGAESGVLYVKFLSCFHANKLGEIIDPELIEEVLPGELEKLAGIARDCLEMEGERRPTMKEVVGRLESIES